MINSDTPYKQAELIRDTWPNLYRPCKDFKPPALLNRDDSAILSIRSFATQSGERK